MSIYSNRSGESAFCEQGFLQFAQQIAVDLCKLPKLKLLIGKIAKAAQAIEVHFAPFWSFLVSLPKKSIGRLALKCVVSAADFGDTLRYATGWLRF